MQYRCKLRRYNGRMFILQDIIFLVTKNTPYLTWLRSTDYVVIFTSLITVYPRIYTYLMKINMLILKYNIDLYKHTYN